MKKKTYSVPVSTMICLKGNEMLQSVSVKSLDDGGKQDWGGDE